MPIYLKDKSEFSELERFNSVLIVPCRFCPAASMAVRKNKPYFEFLRRLLKTGSYEHLIDTIKSNLGKRVSKLMFLRVGCSISLSFACGLQDVEKNY
jgi:hypothetical protein